MPQAPLDTDTATNKDIFFDYLTYTKDTEPPTIYHRWAFLTIMGAVLGRRAHLPLVHSRIFPNLYVMFIGEPAARKSTSIKISKHLLRDSGYTTFAADKTSKEKFLLDLEGATEDDELTGKSNSSKYDAITSENLWGNEGIQAPREMFIVADEFNEFAGVNNLEFFTTLGNLWDFDSPTQPFTQRLKNTKSISIYQPTVSILAGNTPELFARAFPPEAIGSGFLSRLLLIYGERSGRKIAFPPPPDKLLNTSICAFLQKLAVKDFGELMLSPKARELLTDIYEKEEPIPDIRFRAYSNRRFTQLLKLCIILTTAKFQSTVESSTVLYANTILSHAELLMPKALGEFGRSKLSEVSNKIMDIVDKITKPISMKDIWIQVQRDVTNQKDLIELVNGLLQADKLQAVSGNGMHGFLPKKQIKKEPIHVNWFLLTEEERNML
jgi:hypothetical protein